MKDAEHIHRACIEDAPALTRVWIDIRRATYRGNSLARHLRWRRNS